MTSNIAELPATIWAVIGYFVLFSSTRAEGRVFHYVLGAGVALTYPLFYLVLDVPMPANHLVPGLLWGLATTVLPWFTNFPGFG